MQGVPADEADDLASQVYAAVRRAGLDPHGDEGLVVWAAVRTAERDVDAEGRTSSTHPADVMAEQLADVGDDGQVLALRELAAREGKVVARWMPPIAAELERVGLLPTRSSAVPRRRYYIDDSAGIIRTTTRLVQPGEVMTEAEQLEQASLAHYAAQPELGPVAPPRTLEGARVIFEPRLRALLEAGATGLQELDREIASWASCSVRSARRARTREWGLVDAKRRRISKGGEI